MYESVRCPRAWGDVRQFCDTVGARGMSRRAGRRWACWVMALIISTAGVGCSGGSGPDFVKGQEADKRIAEVVEAYRAILPAAGAMGKAGSTEVQSPFGEELRRAGRLASNLYADLKPEKAYEAVTALEGLALEFGRTAGGTPAGSGRIACGSVLVLPPGHERQQYLRRTAIDGSDLGSQRGAVHDSLSAQFHHLALVGLLVDPDARTAFATNMAPDDLPAELPQDPRGDVPSALRNADIKSVSQWRDLLFDSAGRLQLPALPEGEDAGALREWSFSVNPKVATARFGLEAAFEAGFVSG